MTTPTLTPTAMHWGGSIGVYNIVRTDKATGERLVLESSLHSDQVDVDRRATKLWGEHNPLDQPMRYFVDKELLGYYGVKDKERAIAASRPCRTCGK